MPNYKNPPITEAVLEIRIARESPIELQTLDSIGLSLPEYPGKKTLTNFMSNIDVVAEESTFSKQDFGVAFTSGDGKQVVQARNDCFAFSRLNPYIGWNLFKAEAKRLWGIYKAGVQPSLVTRAGLRFINRIDMPLPIKDFKDYLLTVPEIAPDLPQALSGFLMVTESPLEETGCTLRLTEALVPPPSEGIASIMLDIDVFMQTDAPQTEDELWQSIESIRNQKNKFFEACLTPAARRLFE